MGGFVWASIHVKTCPGLLLFEFIKHDKVNFFSARTSPNFSHFPRQVKHALPFNFAFETDPKNIFYYQRDAENYMDQVLNVFLFDRHEYIHMESSYL